MFETLLGRVLVTYKICQDLGGKSEKKTTSYTMRGRELKMMKRQSAEDHIWPLMSIFEKAAARRPSNKAAPSFTRTRWGVAWSTRC